MRATRGGLRHFRCTRVLGNELQFFCGVRRYVALECESVMQRTEPIPTLHNFTQRLWLREVRYRLIGTFFPIGFSSAFRQLARPAGDR